jgi:hypothetical protein
MWALLLCATFVAYLPALRGSRLWDEPWSLPQYATSEVLEKSAS